MEGSEVSMFVPIVISESGEVKGIGRNEGVLFTLSQDGIVKATGKRKIHGYESLRDALERAETAPNAILGGTGYNARRGPSGDVFAGSFRPLCIHFISEKAR